MRAIRRSRQCSTHGHDFPVVGVNPANRGQLVKGGACKRCGKLHRRGSR